jgi:hypothetical protein
MIISFAWTVDALLSGDKTCTRRRWSDAYHQRWVNAYRQGRRVHAAWDKLPFAGGRKVGDVRLTVEPYRERLGDMPPDDLVAEGELRGVGEFMALFGGPDQIVSVVRFELAGVEPGDYPASWTEIAARVKQAAGWRCEHCDHSHDRESGHVLTVHHLNGNPADCRRVNLVALCQRCHLHIQAVYRPGQQVLPGIEAPAWMRKRGLA